LQFNQRKNLVNQLISPETELTPETAAITFADLELIPPILKALKHEGYEHPTEIQARAIPPLLDGRDLLGSAQTGTGKTAAFVLPLLQRLYLAKQRPIPYAPRALILSPTRELAAQIGNSIQAYGAHLRIYHTCIYGGVSQVPQVRSLSRGVDIVIATPGRLLDLMNQRRLRLDSLSTFVLDEADLMLDMGFWPDIETIVSHLPEERQSMFFSATMPPKVSDLANGLLRNPERVEITPEQTTSERVEQSVLFVDRMHKRRMLAELLEDPAVARVLVFSKTKHGAEHLAEWLRDSSIPADAIHGNKSQAARLRTLQDFKYGRFRVLVATDVAARGIDVDGVTHVINFDLPREAEAYVHRIGRTGRARATGVAISICDQTEVSLLRQIERFTGQKLAVDERGLPGFGGASGGRGRGPRSGSGYGGRPPGNRPYGRSARGGSYSDVSRGPGAASGEASRGEAQTGDRSTSDRAAHSSMPPQEGRSSSRGRSERPPRGEGSDNHGTAARSDYGRGGQRSSYRSETTGSVPPSTSASSHGSVPPAGSRPPRSRTKKDETAGDSAPPARAKKTVSSAHSAERSTAGASKPPFGAKPAFGAKKAFGGKKAPFGKKAPVAQKTAKKAKRPRPSGE
jgi:ATP-dependent RNA helicase RhlE